MGYPDMMRDILAQARRDAITNRRKALENLPIVDRLTGLYNREYFDLRLNENRVSEEDIKAISGIISDCLADTIGLVFNRDQGKFAIILPEAGEQEAALTADHIRKAILKEKIQGVNPHAGVAQYNDHENIDELIQAADAALCENNV
jgi:PleD family two-component response regulator